MKNVGKFYRLKRFHLLRDLSLVIVGRKKESCNSRQEPVEIDNKKEKINISIILYFDCIIRFENHKLVIYYTEHRIWKKNFHKAVEKVYLQASDNMVTPAVSVKDKHCSGQEKFVHRL